MRRTVALVACVAAVAAFFGSSASAQSDAAHRAAIVVGEDERCVAFDEPEITGIELLQRADLDVVVDTSARGSAVCRIGSTGCSRDDCFCDFPEFWGYWTRDAGDWEFSQVGAAERKVVDGSIDGWSYGKDGEPAPRDRTFEQVCVRGVVAAPTAVAQAEGTTGSIRNVVPLVAVAAGLVALGLFVVRRRRRGP